MRLDSRGVSEVLGYALVFSLVITTVAIVTVGGVSELQDTRDTEQINNAQRAFDLLKTNMNDIAKRSAPSRSTEMRLAESQLDIGNAVTVRVQTNGSSATDNQTFSYRVSPIVYKSSNADTTLVYSAGAVFRVQGESGIAVKRPAIVASDDRLVIPLIQTRSRTQQSIGGGTVRVRGTRVGETLTVSDTTGRYSNVTVNVTSSRAGLWKDLLTDYPAFNETNCGDVSGTDDEIYCRMESPERVHVSLVQIDIALSD